jgi:hypothetical protein
MAQTKAVKTRLRDEWIARVDALADQVQRWCQAEGWAVARQMKTIREREIGVYDAPELRILVDDGEIHLSPIALEVLGSKWRVDLKGYPTLSRVKLLPAEEGWTIMTDSNVPLRRPWDSKTFVELGHDLLN